MSYEVAHLFISYGWCKTKHCLLYFTGFG